MKTQAGFSLAEIIIYTTLIAIIGTLFGGILVSVTKIQTRQTSAGEVNHQLTFSLQNIQRLIRESSLIDIATGTPVSTLTLRMKDPAKDPTIISLTNGRMLFQQGSGGPTALTNETVVVDNLSFLRISSFPGHDSIQINLTISYNTQTPDQKFTKSLSSAVARVNAATFDADLVPGATNSYDLGLSSAKWQDLQLSGSLSVGGEANISGVASDGTGKAICVKSDGNLGTCSTAPNASGVCTCN